MKLEDTSREDIHRVIDSYIHNERNRAILKRKLTDGITYEMLAEEFDVSVGTVKNVVYKGKDIIFRHLGE